MSINYETADILDEISQMNEKALVPTGYEDAVMGYVQQCGKPALALVDEEKLINLLIERDGMEPDEAAEYYDFNVLGAWVGEHTPVFAVIRRK